MDVAFKIECAEGVSDVLKNVDTMLRDARRWVETGAFGEVHGEVTRPLWNELVEQCDAMEMSWHRCVRAIFNMSSQSGGMQLFRDSATSLLFVEPRTGLTGGIIFHPKVVNGTRTPIGTWSTHT